MTIEAGTARVVRNQSPRVHFAPGSGRRGKVVTTSKASGHSPPCQTAASLASSTTEMCGVLEDAI